jgi:hypothetical protein
MAKNKAKSILLTLSSECPQDGACNVEMFKNKSLEIKTDDLGGIYYEIVAATESSVVLYHYDRKVEKGLQDGQYKEDIVFEINHSDSLILLSGSELQKTKMIFGRHCYCKGQAGYFKVTQGQLTLEQKKNVVSFQLDFTITQVPQIIKSIKATTK